MSEPVTTVVVTYNSAHVIDGLLDSLGPALDGLASDTVVVDNSSTDGTVDVVGRRDDVTLVRAPNLGYAAGINRGVAASAGSGPILILNPDVRLEPGSVRALLEALRRPGTGVAAPRVLDSTGALVPSMRREPTLARNLGLGGTGRPRFAEYVEEPGAYDAPAVCDWALGAVLLVSRECHEALGGWDESFFLYSEETDFCLRARDRGFVTRYEPSAVAMHIAGQSGRSPRIHAMQILNRVRLYRRRHSAVASTAYYLLSVLSEISWVLRGHRDSRGALRALVWRPARPAELGLSGSLVPR
ncbi:glycosyltransferase family 2 protein [Nocardioides panacihumi]|uniref:Glycosyltransferase family 2 protein n=1 Tax=Nocardioides panacihumi TaxID=400774 RepID=A0ABP5CW34_9ACTN